MNIYLITSKDKIEWDTYDLLVCISEDRNSARQLASNFSNDFHSNNTIKKIGETTKINSEQIVLASFNAG